MFSFVCNHVCGLRSVHRKLEVSWGRRGKGTLHRTIHRISYIVCRYVETVAIKTFCMCSINNARPGLGFLLDLDDFDIPLTDMHRRKPPRAGSCLCLALNKEIIIVRGRGREEGRKKCTQMSFIEYRFTLTSLGELRERMLNVNMNK